MVADDIGCGCVWLCRVTRVISLGYNDLGAEGGQAIAVAVRSHPGRLQVLDGVVLSMADQALPLELKTASNKDILNYYRDLLSDSAKASRRCRVMLLGNGGVGKTTLAHRLVTGCPPTLDAGVTHGVLQRSSRSVVLLVPDRERCALLFHDFRPFLCDSQITGRCPMSKQFVSRSMVPWRCPSRTLGAR